MGVFRRRLLLPALVLASGGVAILFYFDPQTHAFYPECLFRAVTGWDCPGCGVLRAIHQLLHGNVAAAARLNLLFVLSLPVIAWCGLWHGFYGMPMRSGLRSALLWIFCGLALVFTVARNLG